MDIQSNYDDFGVCRVRISGELTIYHAAETKPELLTAFDHSAEMELNLADVSEIDSAGLQLLILAKKEAVMVGKQLRLTDHSPAVVEFIQLFDLAGYFGDPVLIQSKIS